MADGKLVGVDLNIDHDFLSGVVREVALTSIAEALDGKNQVIESIVNQVMRQKVDPRDGKPTQYRDGITILEFYVRQMLTEEVRNQVQALIEERREDIAKMIHDKLSSDETSHLFTSAFTKSVAESINNRWYPTIDITFKKPEDY